MGGLFGEGRGLDGQIVGLGVGYGLAGRGQGHGLGRNLAGDVEGLGRIKAGQPGQPGLGHLEPGPQFGGFQPRLGRAGLQGGHPGVVGKPEGAVVFGGLGEFLDLPGHFAAKGQGALGIGHLQPGQPGFPGGLAGP